MTTAHQLICTAICTAKNNGHKQQQQQYPSAHMNRIDTNASDEGVSEEIEEAAPQNEEINRSKCI